MNLLVTVTKERPKAFEILATVMRKQTTKDFHWLVVTDGDTSKYKFPPLAKVIKRDPATAALPSICGNWLTALDWIASQEQYDKILVVEDDDWYHREYVVETTSLLDRADLVGWQEDAYYYCLSRKARRCHNVGFACLASTAFNRSVLPYLRECCQAGTPFIDQLLWTGIKEVSQVVQPPLTLSSGQVMTPPPVSYSRVVRQFTGKKLLVNNFTGEIYGEQPRFTYNDQGKLTMTVTTPPLDERGNIENEHPRHVGMKEPWHGGTAGTSVIGHDPRAGGGPDIFGDKLRDWIGKDDAALYLQFTKDPPRNPYPANIMVPMPCDYV